MRSKRRDDEDTWELVTYPSANKSSSRNNQDVWEKVEGHPSSLPNAQSSLMDNIVGYLSKSPAVSKFASAVEPATSRINELVEGAKLPALAGGMLQGAGSTARSIVDLPLQAAGLPTLPEVNLKKYLPEDQNDFWGKMAFLGGELGGGSVIPGGMYKQLGKLTPGLTGYPKLLGEVGKGALTGYVTGEDAPFGRMGGATLGGFLSGLNLTRPAKAANDVVKEGERQYAISQKQYNKLWDKAENTGHNQVPADMNLLSNNLEFIKKYKTPREYKALETFISKPTLENAQKAQSDMNFISRTLSEKSRAGSLTSEENAMYNAAKEAEKNIEDNMFKNRSGNISDFLKNQYDKITSRYRENVVPYKYNPSIQAFKAKEITPKKLIKELSSGGEFEAKKGHLHPDVMYNNLIKTILGGGAAAVAGKSLYDTYSPNLALNRLSE